MGGHARRGAPRAARPRALRSAAPVQGRRAAQRPIVHRSKDSLHRLSGAGGGGSLQGRATGAFARRICNRGQAGAARTLQPAAGRVHLRRHRRRCYRLKPTRCVRVNYFIFHRQLFVPASSIHARPSKTAPTQPRGAARSTQQRRNNSAFELSCGRGTARHPAQQRAGGHDAAPRRARAGARRLPRLRGCVAARAPPASARRCSLQRGACGAQARPARQRPLQRGRGRPRTASRVQHAPTRRCANGTRTHTDARGRTRTHTHTRACALTCSRGGAAQDGQGRVAAAGQQRRRDGAPPPPPPRARHRRRAACRAAPAAAPPPLPGALV